MATIYDGINYFPVGVNFMEENAMEVIEAKYGIKGSAIVPVSYTHLRAHET